MVPGCVPEVMRETGILSLEIQRMPKRMEWEFSDPAAAPYMSVVSPSTHDMPTLRQWWREDPRQAQRMAWLQLSEHTREEQLSGAMAARILSQHLESPAMWTLVPLQDLLALDESLRHPDPDAERINVPAIMPYNWRYRMHLELGQLLQASGLTGRIAKRVEKAGRGGGRH